MRTLIGWTAPSPAPSIADLLVHPDVLGWVNELFHRVIRYGIIQGGDPLSKDLMRVGVLGTGGLNQLRAEFTDDDYSRGAVAGVILPGKPDSAGSQFFICVTDQKDLVGRYTVFGKVVDGMDHVDRIAKGEPPKKPDKIVKMSLAQAAT